MSTPLKVGPKALAWLRQVGIRTQEDLQQVGAVAAYVKCKRAGFRPSLNMLYSLEGSLLGCHWQKVPAERRAELLAQAEEQVASLPPPRSRAASLVVSEVHDYHGDGAEGSDTSGLFDSPDSTFDSDS